MELKDFLVKAKKATYANGKALRVNSTRIASKDYHYQETINKDEFIYHDTYFGGLNFIGSEVVYKNNNPIWGMNYFGISLDDSENNNAIKNALRPALCLVGEDNKILPLRGPKKFINNEYKYTFRCKGTLQEYSGEEKIYKNNKLIYKLLCNGGEIK